ncbi:MAG TPA: hypothetical protein VGS08_03730 [Candidatus Saccharimonadales bacterium]|nr:hypothetical protein [Candidatus Saccharimonadales bacterium]
MTERYSQQLHSEASQPYLDTTWAYSTGVPSGADIPPLVSMPGEGIATGSLTPEAMSDIALARMYVIGNLILRRVIDTDIQDWTHKAGALLAVSGALTLDGNLKPELATILLTRWQGDRGATQEKTSPTNFSIPFSSPETRIPPFTSRHSAKPRQPRIPFSGIVRDYYDSATHQAPFRESSIPEARFSNQKPWHQSPPPRPYMPTFDVKFKGASFSPAATAEAQRILAKVASEKDIKRGDVLGRVDIAREAFMRAHPDKGGATKETHNY